MKRAKYRSVVLRLFDYGELAESITKITTYLVLALYIVLITGLLALGSVATSTLGIITLRAVFIVLLLVMSTYTLRELRVTRSKAERRKTVWREARRSMYLLIIVLIAIAVFYVILLLY